MIVGVVTAAYSVDVGCLHELDVNCHVVLVAHLACGAAAARVYVENLGIAASITMTCCVAL